MWQLFRLKSLCLSLTLSDRQINSFVVKVWESALPRHNRKVNTWITCKSTVDLSKRSSQKIRIFYYSVCDRNMPFCFVIKSHLDSYTSTLLKFYVYSFSRLLFVWQVPNRFNYGRRELLLWDTCKMFIECKTGDDTRRSRYLKIAFQNSTDDVDCIVDRQNSLVPFPNYTKFY